MKTEKWRVFTDSNVAGVKDAGLPTSNAADVEICLWLMAYKDRYMHTCMHTHATAGIMRERLSD